VVKESYTVRLKNSCQFAKIIREYLSLYVNERVEAEGKIYGGVGHHR
jgi:hypothetical protein